VKTLPPRAADLAARRDLRPIWLVTLTTYTDRAAGTVDTIFRFSDRVVLYDYGNTGTEREFARALLGIDALTQAMHHLADPSASSLTRELTLRLANLPLEAGGARLYEVLEAHRLLFATVEIAQILLDSGKRESTATIRGLAGDEHVVWFRGEVAAHGADEQAVKLTVRAVSRALPWIVANDPAKNDPSDLGRRLPIVIGARPKVPAVGYTVGWVTTCAHRIANGTDTGAINVTDASGLSGSAIPMRLGNEDVLVSYIDDKTVNLTARGQNGTTATPHGVGETMIEMVATIVYVVAGHAVKAINNVYFENPSSGELVRIPGGFTKTISDSSTISGKTVASVTFTAAQLRSVLNDLFPEVDFDGGVQTFRNEYSSLSVDPAGGNDAVGAVGGGYAALDVSVVTDNNDSIETRLPAAPEGEEQVIVRHRRIVEYSMQSDFARSMTLFAGATEVDTIAADAPTELGHRWASSWVAGNGTETIGDWVGDLIELTITHSAGNPNGDGRWYALRTFREFEVLTGATSSLAGSVVGFGLRLYADLEGPVASGGSYSVANGVLLEHPSDVLRYVLAELAGYGHGAIDDATFDALVTALGSGAKMAPILNELGESLEAVVLRLAHEARTNLVQEEGAAATLFKAYAASTSHEWGAAERTLTLWDSFELESRDGSEVATRFRALYAPDLSRRSEDDLWRKALRADPEVSDLSGLATSFFAAREADYGRRDHPGYAFATLYDDATAKDAMTYYAREESRDGRVAIVKGVPWWDGYDLERATKIAATPPWGSAPLLWRLVSYRKDPATELVDLRLVEVVA